MGIFKRSATVVTPLDVAEAISGQISEQSSEISTLTNSSALKSYKNNPIIYSAWSMLASDVAALNIDLLDPQGKDVQSSSYLELLEKPNQYQSKYEFMELLTIHILSGAAFIDVIRIGGVPRELHLLHPDEVSVRRVATGEYEYRYNGETIEPENMIMIRMPSAETENSVIKGMSPMTPGSGPYQLNNEGRRWNNKLLLNGARASGVVTVGNTVSNQMLDDWKSRFESQMTLRQRLGKMIYMREGMKFEDVGQNNRDLDFYNLHVLSSRELAIVLHIPPELLGDSANKTYANVQEAYKAFGTHAIKPMVTRICSALTRALLPNGWKYDVADDEIPGMSEAQTELWNRVITARNAGVLTYNEARELLGYGPVAGGDVLLVNMGNVPLTDASEPLPDLSAVEKEGENMKGLF